MRKLTKAELLANGFSEIINDWIPDKMYEINLRNKEPQYKTRNWCATHDFCDPNQAMIDAFKKLYNKELSTTNKKHLELINHAWNLAKTNDFKPIN
jgi:hypothetical protein